MKYFRALLLSLSLVCNIVFGSIFLIKKINSPQERLGILMKDIAVGEFNRKGVIFRLPKGLTVADASPRAFAAIDRFEPERFSIVVTTNQTDLVDYSEGVRRMDGDTYSADRPK